MQVPKSESGLDNLVFVLVGAVRTHSSVQGAWARKDGGLLLPGPKPLIQFPCRFSQCHVPFRYSISFLFGGAWHFEWEALHGARWRRNFSPAPPVP